MLILLKNAKGAFMFYKNPLLFITLIILLATIQCSKKTVKPEPPLKPKKEPVKVVQVKEKSDEEVYRYNQSIKNKHINFGIPMKDEAGVKTWDKNNNFWEPYAKYK